MRYILLLLLTLTTSFSSMASTQLICSMIFVKGATKIAIEHSQNDKDRHCSVSCMLTLKCPALEVAAIGVLKEIKDLLARTIHKPGDPDINDIKADLDGISLATSQTAVSNSECLQECDKYYPPNL